MVCRVPAFSLSPAILGKGAHVERLTAWPPRVGSSRSGATWRAYADKVGMHEGTLISWTAWGMPRLFSPAQVAFIRKSKPKPRRLIIDLPSCGTVA